MGVLIVAVKLLCCALLALPVAGAAWVLMARRWGRGTALRGWTPAESLLAGLVATVVAMYLFVVAWGTLPRWLLAVPRPLDALVAVQVVMSGALACWLWEKRGELWALASHLRDDGAMAWRDANPWQRGVVVLGACATLAMQGFGAWSSPASYDTLTYHIPQMMQPVQDGYLGTVSANVAWADTYPRGAALLYAWGMLMVRSDAVVHATSGVFAWVFALAVIVACRRLGIRRASALTSAGAIVTTPVILMIGASGYIDLIVGALVASMIAFALPRRREDGEAASWRMPLADACAMLMCLVMAMWCKIVPICLGGVVLAWCVAARGLGTWHAWRGRDESRRGVGGVGLFGLLGLSVVAGALAIVPYAMTWATYGSPTYPMRLRVGPVLLFEGPLGTENFGRFNTEGLLERFTLMWGSVRGAYDNIDTPGGFGPLFVLLGFASCVVVLVALVLPQRADRGGRWWRGGWQWRVWHDPTRFGWALLAGVLLANLAAPEHHVTRYTIATLLVPAACMAWLGDRLRDSALAKLHAGPAGLAALTLALCAWNVQRFAQPIPAALAWQRAQGMELLGEHRNRDVWVRVARPHQYAPSGRTMAKLHELVKPGELLVSAVIQDYFALYWDNDYTIRVEHHDCDPEGAQMYFDQTMNFAQERGLVWLEDLPEDAKVVVVYRDAPEGWAMREAGRGFGFVLAYAQPEEDGGPPVDVYRRVR